MPTIKTLSLSALFMVAMFLCAPLCVWADGIDEIERSPLNPPGVVLTPGSDAGFDNRLPPVLPGEEVSDGSKTMKVWSSAGPVPVHRAPDPGDGESPGQKLLEKGSIGVIVDQRKVDQKHEQSQKDN